jgi:hypothetical protein
MLSCTLKWIGVVVVALTLLDAGIATLLKAPQNA